MRRRLAISGSTLRLRSDDFKAAQAREVERHLWPVIAPGQLRPVLEHTFPLVEAAAHRLLEASIHSGKIVFAVA